MGERIAELSAGLVMAALMLTILVVLSGAFLVVLILILIVGSLLKRNKAEVAEEGPVQRLGLFDAPVSNWWVERYDQWLFRLEEILGINFSQTPGRLFFGSMALAAVSGGLLAGAGYLLVGPEAVLPVLLVAVLGNGLSAYALSRPMTAMFEPLPGGREGADGPARAGGLVIGEPLDW